MPKLEKIRINDLNYIPQVNIIVPAWKEGEDFKICLEKILEINYPKLKVIVNAGGDNKTKEIAGKFKKYENFQILDQKKGEGKVKAVFDCIDYVDSGIIYVFDSDMCLNNDIFFKMIYTLVNKDKGAIVSNITPHSSIRNKDSVKYLLINRNSLFRHIPTNTIERIGPHWAIKYEILKNSKYESIRKMKDDGRAFGFIIKEKGFKIHTMFNEYIESFTYPYSISEYFNQNLRWLENAYYRKRGEKKKLVIFKLFIIFVISIFMVSFPFLIYFDFFFLYYGVAALLYFYLQKLRKIIFFKKTDENSSQIHFGILFYLKIFLFIYLDLLINIVMVFEIVFYKKRYKERKNLL